MPHAAQALLRKKGLQYKKHSGVHAAFGEHFAQSGVLHSKYHRWLLDAFDERLRGDYDFQTIFDIAGVALWMEQLQEFLRVVRNYLESSPTPPDR
jgi:uncharacterized protein (UPF0332 family)